MKWTYFKRQSCIAGNKRNQTTLKSERICNNPVVPRFSLDGSARISCPTARRSYEKILSSSWWVTAAIHPNTFLAGV
jgi:hypothetical protein